MFFVNFYPQVLRLDQSYSVMNIDGAGQIAAKNSHFHGWKSVIGGFLIHLVLGTLYLWGNITEAVTAHLRKYDESITYNDTILVYACALAGQGCFMIVGGLIEARIGARWCCLLGGAILVSGTLLSSTATTLSQLLITDGIMFGVGMGICYTAPIACAARWMPEKKGLLSGIIVAGFGGGAFIFGQIALQIVNSERIGIVSDGTSKESYYPSDSDVANAVPSMFLNLGLCYSVLILVGSCLLSDPPTVSDQPLIEICEGSPTGVEENRIPNRVPDSPTVKSYQPPQKDKFEAYSSKRTYHPLATNGSGYTLDDVGVSGEFRDQIGPPELFRSPLAWQLSSCMITTTIGGMYLCGTYKTFGQLTFSDEMYLSTIASTASLFSAAGRIFWGALGDKIGASEALIIMTFIFSITILTYPSSLTLGKAGFAIWTFLIFFLEGGNFALYMPVTIDTFGGKLAGANYGIIFTSYSIFSVLNITLLAKFHVSYSFACQLMAALTFFGFADLCFFRRAVARSSPLSKI